MVLVCIKLEKNLTRTLLKQEDVQVLWAPWLSSEIIYGLFLYVPKATRPQWNTNRPGTNFNDVSVSWFSFLFSSPLWDNINYIQSHCSEDSSGLSSTYTQLSSSIPCHTCPSWPQCVPNKQMQPNPCLKIYFGEAQTNIQSKWMSILLECQAGNALTERTTVELLALFQPKRCIKATHSVIFH